MTIWLALMLAALSTRSAAADLNFQTKVTVRRTVDGKPDPGVSVIHLRCRPHLGCVMTSFTFDQCRDAPPFLNVGGGQASPISVEQTSTIEGTLHVTAKGHGRYEAVEKLADVGGVGDAIYTFQLSEGDRVSKLTDFHGRLR